MCTPGYGITLDRFMRVAHLLPRQSGNVAVDNYRFVNALLWMCRTGAPWRDLPECYGKWITVCRRFNRWSGNGAMERLFTALQEERIIGVEIRVLAMDSTSVKVHQHATGAPKKRPQSAGVFRGGRNAKVRVASDSGSTLVEIHPGPGNEHDAAHGRRSMAAPGAFMGAHLLMDRAYEGDSTRLLAESFGLMPVVPPKRNRTDPWDYDREAHKGRNMVERVFNRMKHHRKAAARYDRLDETFLAEPRLILIAIYLKNTAKNSKCKYTLIHDWYA